MNVAPFQLPAESVEIVLDLPFPPSINSLWRISGKRMIKSKQYVAWMAEADDLVMAKRAYPKKKIQGQFELCVALAAGSKADGDNCASKAILDWLQSRDIIPNDKFCAKGRWEWVAPDQAPEGCRVTLRSLHGAA